MQQQEFSKVVIYAAKTLGNKFTLRSEPVDFEKHFSATGLLPALLKRAEQLSQFCLGYGLGLTFERYEGATLGVKVNLNDKVATSLRLLCVIDVLIDLSQNYAQDGVVPLDVLLDD